MKNLFNDGDSPTPAQAPITRQWAKMLYEQAKTQGYPPPRWRKWEQHFAQLQRVVRDDALITKVLTWYCANCAAHGAAPTSGYFCSQFPRWRNTMLYDPDYITPTPAQAALADAWRAKGWPAGLDRLVGVVTAHSWGNYEAFMAKFVAAMAWLDGKLNDTDVHNEQWNTWKRHRQFMGWLYDAKLWDAHSFVDSWLRLLHTTLGTIPRWNGTVAGLVFTPDGQRFTRLAEQWAYEFCEDSSRWRVVRDAYLH